MKRFLLIFIFTSLLFGQDVLNLKNGDFFWGTFYGKDGEDIIFKVERETSTQKFSINDVDAIITKYDGELTYPFDIPIRHSIYKNQSMSAAQKNDFNTLIGCAGIVWLIDSIILDPLGMSFKMVVILLLK